VQGSVDRPSDNYRWWVLVTVVFGAFASILDSTIVNTALPRIQHDFGAGLHVASYVVTGYILAAGVIVPASGYLANRFGMKRVYVSSLALFTAGSALCGAAPNINLLIAARILQGAGGAALFPLSFALLFSVFPSEERGKANGIFGIPVLAAPALGPTLGGYLTQYVDWRWVFYVNLPVGILGVILGLRFLRETPVRKELRFDFRGFLLASSGLGLLLYGISNLAYDGWNSTRTVSGPILVSIVLLAGFVIVTWGAAAPLLRLRLYQRRNYVLAAGISLVAAVAIFAPGFFMPQYLQGLRGQTPFQAGLLLLWGGVGAVIGSITTGQLYNRLGPKLLIYIGLTDNLIITGITAVWLTATSNLAILPPLFLISGIGMPMMFQSVNTLALDGIRGPELPDATTLSVVTRNVMGSLSIAVLTNFLQSRATLHIQAIAGGAGKAFAHMGVGGVSGNQMPAAVRDALALSYHETYVLLTIVVLPTFVIAWFLRQPSWRVKTVAASPPASGSAVPQERVLVTAE
jgi:EmrB/QacA subfamily drug resistance transporter